MIEMPSIRDIKVFKYNKKMEAQQKEMENRILDGEVQVPGEYIPQIQRAPPSQQMMYASDDNPFEMAQYQQSQIPDAPIIHGGGMAESLLNDREVPKQIRDKYWFAFHKDNTLTFLDKERKKSKLLNFDITKIDILNSIPYYEYSFEKELEFNIMRNVFETKLDRAMGYTGGNIKNERIMLQSQFSENRQINEMGSQNRIKEGFFKRLLGRR